MDCLTCGACCYQHPGTILVTENDLEHWRELGREDILARLTDGHFGFRAFAMKEDSSCVHHGVPGSPHACAIYELRASVCRDFEVGCAQCREFRRDRGVE